MLNKRVVLGMCASLLSTVALAQVQSAPPAGGRPRRPVPRRTAGTKVLFKAPEGKYINGVASAPDGIWLAEQHEAGGPTSNYRYKDGRPLEVAPDPRENAWLVDGSGKILRTVVTESRNTSGLAVGGGYVWMGANSAGHNGVSQVSMESRIVSLRQVPFGPPQDGGGIHGLCWVDGKLWIASLRLRSLVRVDAASWAVDYMIPLPPEFERFHGCAYDAATDSVLVVTGNNSTGYANGKPGLVRMDVKTATELEVIDLEPNSCDPHGLAFHQGKLISCDAGLHPGWPINDSPYSGTIFQINIV